MEHIENRRAVPALTKSHESKLRAQKFASMSRISSMLLCQTKGSGLSFQLSIQSAIADSSSLVNRCVPRRL